MMQAIKHPEKKFQTKISQSQLTTFTHVVCFLNN